MLQLTVRWETLATRTEYMNLNNTIQCLVRATNEPLKMPTRSRPTLRLIRRSHFVTTVQNHNQLGNTDIDTAPDRAIQHDDQALERRSRGLIAESGGGGGGSDRGRKGSFYSRQGEFKEITFDSPVSGEMTPSRKTLAKLGGGRCPP